ncbi:hypothetical protein EDC27_3003 [Desulfosoma caldarium]|uniref:Uncharacterized protein n=1 Tax=Desulfosoma caldarium TaxID=610254 RepID=A0A3N1US17_9BACT|nr:hypothetical protein EDC27_3003 [Desulfosoma caldarium]
MGKRWSAWLLVTALIMVLRPAAIAARTIRVCTDDNFPLTFAMKQAVSQAYFMIFFEKWPSRKTGPCVSVTKAGHSVYVP